MKLKGAGCARTEKAEGRGRFERFRPLISTICKRTTQTIGAALIVSAIAIGGANLGTYFDYVYNNYGYRKAFRNRTVLVLKGPKPEDEITDAALETARLMVVGAAAPESAKLSIKITKNNDSITMSTEYAMYWSNSHIIKKRDEEILTVIWSYDSRESRFIPIRALTRYHYKEVEFDLGTMEALVIVVQNPAHTPGIPGALPHYTRGSPGALDIFTKFSAEKWAGSCLSTGLPQHFSSLGVEFLTTLTYSND